MPDSSTPVSRGVNKGALCSLVGGRPWDGPRGRSGRVDDCERTPPLSGPEPRRKYVASGGEGVLGGMMIENS